MSLVWRIFKRLMGLGIIAAMIALVLFFVYLPGYADAERNAVAPDSLLPDVSDSALALHSRLTIVDLHADPLVWRRNLLSRNTQGQVDVPRLVDGRVAIQVFSAVTKVPPGLNYESNPSDEDQLTWLAVASMWPVATWDDLVERARYQAQRLDRAAADSRGRLIVLRSQGDVERYLGWRAMGDTARVAGILALEGLQAIDTTLELVDTLYHAGFRIMGLTHFADNAVGGSATGEMKGGLTEFGKVVVVRMEDLGVIVDLAHASPQLIADVVAVARRPVIVSHTGAQGVCPGPANLDDQAIRAVAGTGGLIGVAYSETAVCDVTPGGIARSIRYVADVGGAAHVALGSDFDGAVQTAFDTSRMSQITQALLGAGFTTAEIAGIMGGNALRVLRAGLP